MHGIIHEVAPPYAPQSNGKNRTLLDMVNAMLVSYGLPKNMCGEALYFACQILNRELKQKSLTEKKLINSYTKEGIF